MKITKQWLEKHDACEDGQEWFFAQKETDAVAVIKKLMEENHFDYANWTICRVFNKKQRVMYAVFSARLVLKNFEKEFPEDKRPREAIEAAEAYLKNPCEKTKSAAWSAESAARSAAGSAESAESAAWSAESAARSAESAVWSGLQKKIITYGLSLLEQS